MRIAVLQGKCFSSISYSFMTVQEIKKFLALEKSQMRSNWHVKSVKRASAAKLDCSYSASQHSKCSRWVVAQMLCNLCCATQHWWLIWGDRKTLWSFLKAVPQSENKSQMIWQSSLIIDDDSVVHCIFWIAFERPHVSKIVLLKMAYSALDVQPFDETVDFSPLKKALLSLLHAWIG